MKLRVAHIAEVADQIRSQTEEDVLHITLFPPEPKLLKLGFHQILVVKVGILAPTTLLLKHSGSVSPFIVSESALHDIIPEFATVSDLGRESDGAGAFEKESGTQDDGKQEVRITRVEGGKEEGSIFLESEKGREAPSPDMGMKKGEEFLERLTEKDMEGKGTSKRGRRANGEGTQDCLIA